MGARHLSITFFQFEREFNLEQAKQVMRNASQRHRDKLTAGKRARGETIKKDAQKQRRAEYLREVCREEPGE